MYDSLDSSEMTTTGKLYVLAISVSVDRISSTRRRSSNAIAFGFHLAQIVDHDDRRLLMAGINLVNQLGPVIELYIMLDHVFVFVDE